MHCWDEQLTRLGGWDQMHRVDDIAQGRPMTLGAPPSQSTPITVSQAVAEVDEHAYQAIRNQRQQQLQAPQVPNFSDSEPVYQDDVNDLYEHAEQARQTLDLLQAPDGNLELPFDPMTGFTVRSNPTHYEKPPSPPTLQQLIDRTPTFNPDAYDADRPPVSTERLNRPTVIRASDAHSDIAVDYAVQANRMNNFSEEPPQPAQMRLLIPKTSRNLVHDSNHIPHIFVVNSAADH